MKRTDALYQSFVEILREELVPAMGCTEPIAIAYAAAQARAVLGKRPERVRIEVSGNIIKNVKSVVVPHTGSMHGIAAAAAAGIIAGREEKELEVLSEVTDEQIETVTDTLLELGLDELSLKPVCSLSGGQKQLVFMAQAFVFRPRVLLDEPTSALDLRHQLVVMDLARRYTRQSGAVTLFVVHDLMLASRYGNRLLMLHEGRIRAFDAAERVLMPYLLGDVYDVEACVERTPPGFLNVIPVRPL